MPMPDGVSNAARLHWIPVFVAAAFLLISPRAAYAATQLVEICHRPPGNPEARTVLRVGERAAEAHFVNHEDTLFGPELCDGIDNDCDGEVDEGYPGGCGGKGKGAAAAVSYQCLGFQEQLADGGSPFSYVTDAVILDAGTTDVTLQGTASGDLAEVGVTARPFQGAATSIDTGALVLQPFDLCASTAESLLDSVVRGVYLLDPTASGVVDVEFHVHYDATLELESLNSPADFTAFTETSLEVPGLAAASFTVSSDGEVIEVPPGLFVQDISSGSRRAYRVSGTYVALGQLLYGPRSRNVVTTVLFAASETAEVSVEGARVVAGFASVDAMDSLDYEIISLDPNVEFSFVPEAAFEAR